MAGSDEAVAVIGAGAGGLASAIVLAAAGHPVTVFEAAPGPGGKIRQLSPAGRPIDTGPTVFTMREVFERLFALAGLSLDQAVGLSPMPVLARHAWQDDHAFDLPADRAAACDAVGDFFGAREAEGFGRFTADARRVHDALRTRFMEADKPGPLAMGARFGLRGLPDLLATRPFQTLWDRLGTYFSDPRLRQLFGRYATYAGGSPFLAPSTLMLIAHVELEGVWQVTGGMGALAQAMEAAARRLGVVFRYGTRVQRIEAAGGAVQALHLADGERVPVRCIVANMDAGAVSSGLLGDQAAFAVNAPVSRPQRSLSAVTWAVEAQARGFGLAHHTVFFGADYRGEFDTILQQRALPQDPTIYICAQDRHGAVAPDGAERLLLLVNAPADGDLGRPRDEEIEACTDRMLAALARRGLHLSLKAVDRTGPAQLETLFPGTGGAIYGPAPHGPWSPFRRAGARTRLRGLWLAGGSVHPSAGVPMAVLSGLTCARQLLADRASTSRSRPVAMAGGISTPSATTVASA